MKFLKIFICLIFFCNCVSAQNGSLKVRSDAFIQIGYDNYKTLSFGKENNSPNNGKFAIEHWQPSWGGVGGLNFWKPWPTSNSSNYVLFLRDDKKVAIGGYGSSSYKLKVYGSAFSTGNWVASDIKFKEDIQPIGQALDKITKLRPVNYKYKMSVDKYPEAMNKNLEEDDIKRKTIANDSKIEYNSERVIGFIAQDLQQIYPELVKEDEEGHLAINYEGLIPVLVKAIMEQQEQINDLKNKK